MKLILRALVLAGILLTGQTQAQTMKSKKPNIIFIVADDLGYGNLTSYNQKSPIPTPNIDRLAKEGTKFTRFYSGSTVCAPSRCALMTGYHMGHAYVRGNSKAKDGTGALRAQDTTMAQRLQQNGYVTGMFGKWGLGDEETQGAPHLKGFNEFYGYLDQAHAHDYYTNRLLEIRDNKTQTVKVDTTQYTQDLIVNKALAFLKNHKEDPFFLYLPLTLPHAELKVPKELLKKFQKADGSSKFGPETPFQKKNNYDSQPQPRAAFAAMVSKLDGDVGKIVELVKQLGLDDNTYIFFTSDNGPHKEGGGDPVFFNSSGPLRGVKRDLYEGGIRVPLLVRAPGRVPAGKVSDQPWAFWDILPTVGQLTATPTPANIDGISFAEALAGKTPVKKHDYFYWQFKEGELKEAVTQGYWKLIRFKEEGKPELLELYNLQNDLSEKSNLAAKNPTKVKELKALMVQAKTPSENKTFDWTSVEQ
ncbi:sulfatase [Adhaeribacter arboris]|uniref:Sulfatase n=1 Tax=Adhaeribacter arboris TaxID=2072846 RepID=A0A2T2YD51_9BACT|nr:arylsulfatase [Adhaeribacter arboris]PSR53439.1 sulfatase [Adhaeribacter arboris]